MAVRYNAVFKKTSDMVYISHLDLMNLFRRAFRRAGLPFVLTEGFTPRIKISIPQALKLGVESNNEHMSFLLSKEKDVRDIAGVLNKELPEGIRILDVKIV